MSSQTRWRWWSRVGKLTESKMDVVETDESEVDDEDTVDNDDEDVYEDFANEPAKIKVHEPVDGADEVQEIG
jgi:hypothetical protein